MTNARFLSNNSITCEANHVNLKYFCRIMVHIKSPKTFRNWSRGLPTGAILYQKVEIFDILGVGFPPHAPIEVKFCTAKWTHMPVSTAKFH